MEKYSAIQVADWFLANNKMDIEEKGDEPISNLKLQKLLYYAQGTYLGITGETLFEDPIVAWKHGPVVASIYHKYKVYGNNRIEKEEYSFTEFDSKTTRILEEVNRVFGQYSAWKLREMTHMESPWNTTKQGEKINPVKIKDYFVENYIVG